MKRVIPPSPFFLVRFFDQAKKLCATLPHPLLLTIGKRQSSLGALDAEIDALRERLGALDGREPDRIPVA